MEENRFDLKGIREQTDLVSLLSKLGFEPLKRSGGELFYLSMLRENDTAPSFCVNEKLGLWYDHGLAKGGTVIDFALAYWTGCDFRQAMEKLNEASGSLQLPPPIRPAQMEIPLRHPSYQIREIRESVGNPAISAYLSQRGILEVAGPFIKEVYYSIKKENGRRMELFAAGWQNDLGGWEVRNSHFKGCLGKKSMRFISGESHLAVFEGMMDFLSWKLEHPSDAASVLILNSVAFLKPAMRFAQGYSAVELFFDHDPSGKKASGEFLKNLPWAADRSELYEGFNDYNEKIQHMTGKRMSRGGEKQIPAIKGKQR
ncbi:toprim domain-containing protein [Pedobacter psychrodurus]|uniref:toprim domain-containing protein n=1 Tax=Pedobacter psychrodurus TaxID=2530456 RepID=UPI002931494C|nr:toprim domain-containing protein [Pedobacter psychrodurus]